jgi:hypothetical protein
VRKCGNAEKERTNQKPSSTLCTRCNDAGMWGLDHGKKEQQDSLHSACAMKCGNANKGRTNQKLGFVLRFKLLLGFFSIY